MREQGRADRWVIGDPVGDELSCETAQDRRAREHAATDQEARRQLMLRIATTLADKLTDVPEAILAYRAVIDDFGASVPTLAALATLYEIADRWQDLVETVEAQLALETGSAERLALLARLSPAGARQPLAARVSPEPAAADNRHAGITASTSSTASAVNANS